MALEEPMGSCAPKIDFELSLDDATRQHVIGGVDGHNSFQARPFYERLGYAVFGAVEDCPPGHTKFHLEKVLA